MAKSKTVRKRKLLRRLAHKQERVESVGEAHHKDPPTDSPEVGEDDHELESQVG